MSNRISHKRSSKLDHEAFYIAGEVDRELSVTDNLEATFWDLALMFVPEKTLKKFPIAPFVPAKERVGVVTRTLLIGIGSDLLDLATGPLFAVKDVADAAFHGIAWGIEAITD